MLSCENADNPPCGLLESGRITDHTLTMISSMFYYLLTGKGKNTRIYTLRIRDFSDTDYWPKSNYIIHFMK
jgi:hypothetical protein